MSIIVYTNLTDEEKKDKAVELTLAFGSHYKAAYALGLDRLAVKKWAKQPWWEEKMAEKKAEQVAVLDTKLSETVDKSLEIIADRLENGEQILNNKTGELVVKPVSLKDATKVANDLLQRQTQLRKQQEEEQTVAVPVKETLAILANEFAKWARTQANKSSAVEATIIENEE